MPAFGPLNCGNSTLDHRLHLLEGARLNLPHRSPETPNSRASTPSGIGSSASRRASKIRRSRTLSSDRAWISAWRRFSSSSS